mgnify:CR=1 FL=1
MKTKQSTIGISKDTVISEILEKYPERAMMLSEKMMEFGIHCVGCGASTFETLEQGVLGHGYSEEELEILVKNLNKIISEKTLTKETTFKTFSLQLTDKALRKVSDIMKQEKKEKSTLRVSILAGGCSGHTYDMEIVDKPIATDLNFKQGSVNIAVDKSSLDYLNGIIVDFVDTLNESGFKFNNPNAHKSCGCGKSFR